MHRIKENDYQQKKLQVHYLKLVNQNKAKNCLDYDKTKKQLSKR